MICQQSLDAFLAVRIHVQKPNPYMKSLSSTIAINYGAPCIDTAWTVWNRNCDGIVAANLEWTVSEETEAVSGDIHSRDRIGADVIQEHFCVEGNMPADISALFNCRRKKHAAIVVLEANSVSISKHLLRCIKL